jgi:hypothetical protein
VGTPHRLDRGLTGSITTMTTETDIDETVPEDVTGLKRKVRELLRQVRKLKGKPVDNDDPAETPREKFVRENAARLKAFEPGSAEWQAEHDKILTEMEPLIAAEAAAHGGEALSARMSAAIVKGRREQSSLRSHAPVHTMCCCRMCSNVSVPKRRTTTPW